MRRGAPPSGANPFPMPLPLNASTAAAGLTAAQQQHQQHLRYQIQQQQQQDSDECEASAAVQARATALQAGAHSRSPGAPSSCTDGNFVSSTAGAAYNSGGSAAGSEAASVPAQCYGLATWTSVPGQEQQGTAAAAAGGPGVGLAEAAASPAGLDWGGSSSSSSLAVLPQAPGNALPKVVIERGPATGNAGAALAGAPGSGTGSLQPGKAQQQTGRAMGYQVRGSKRH